MSDAGLVGLLRLPKGLLGDRGDRSVNLRFALVCILLMPGVLALGAALTGSFMGAATGLVTFTIMAVVAGLALKAQYQHDRLGIANIVTLLRTAIIAALAAPLTQPGLLAMEEALAWTVLGVAVFSLCLDGVDGYFARRQKLTSDFGARFDMEVDSIFALLLAVLAMQSGKAGLWILLLGGMRYAFLAAGLLLPWLDRPLPERFSRKAICVIQIAVLIGLLAPIISGPLSWALAASGTLLLTYSFGRDVVWLARHRA
ncbi:CDP-alcohol phosphatidyltransferase family protein [Devosia beringensis]|uniref:CDP-alcohol phosphatidyltransferase family protein n=1 Tax=Devosia beringensis TaxID=2657486 RepID=UPI00186B6F21|nr:CDP-alcohol phosphatidyltransferase family protein [Devosia beringensis]